MRQNVHEKPSDHINNFAWQAATTKKKKGKEIEKIGSAEVLCYLSLNGTLAENSKINISSYLAWL